MLLKPLLKAIGAGTPRPWLPDQLFRNGEVGVWYDPSDLSTLFQDAAGTTPVTGVEQPVGLMLDKSRGLKVGPELFDGDFSAFTQTEDGWTITSEKLSCDGLDASEFAILSAIFTNNIGYREITFTISNYVSGQLAISVTNGTEDTQRFSANGTYTVRAFDYENTVRNLYFKSINFNGEITALSLKEVAGYHAYQTTAAARPVYREDGATSYLFDDQIDDQMIVTLPAMPTATVVEATDDGVSITYPVNIPAGAYVIDTTSTLGRDYGRVIINRELTAAEQFRLQTYLDIKRGAA